MSFDCGGYYKKYDMTGEIHIGTGIIKVHDIFDPLPDFMKQADVVLSDPPYNQSALSGFYTKADIKEKKKFVDFFNRFFDVIREIKPRILIIEVGDAEETLYANELRGMYKNVIMKEALYYNKMHCLFYIASNEEIPEFLQNLPMMNEEKIIDLICKELDYECICDPCMGTGLVGWYSNKYGKKFVGTDLNKKRLGLLVEGISIGKKLSK